MASGAVWRGNSGHFPAPDGKKYVYAQKIVISSSQRFHLSKNMTTILFNTPQGIVIASSHTP
jgi:hypothetical protein